MIDFDHWQVPWSRWRLEICKTNLRGDSEGHDKITHWTAYDREGMWI